jgi:hypothetical protein
MFSSCFVVDYVLRQRCRITVRVLAGENGHQRVADLEFLKDGTKAMPSVSSRTIISLVRLTHSIGLWQATPS